MSSPRVTKCVAMDCEMVGIGQYYRIDMLARVSLVNEHGEVLYDTFVKPTQKVTDYRTPVSGVRKSDLDNGKEFSVVQQDVKDIIRGKIVVGHSLDSDFDVLKISHPASDIRDTSTYLPFELMNRGRTPGLKWLAKKLLGKSIQTGEHSSVEDARAVMQIYQKVAWKWKNPL